MNRNNSLLIIGFLLLVGSIAWAQQLGPPGTGLGTAATTSRTTPGYLAGRFYPTGDFATIATTAVPTLDTVVFVYPWSPKDEPLTAVSLSTRVQTGVASCSIKIAIWQSSTTTKLPSGTPVVGSNTGQVCATSATSPLIAVSFTFQPGIVYWMGTAVSTGNSQMYSCNVAGALGNGVWAQLGTTTNISVSSCALSAPYAFATDITALNLTGATFTDVLVGGVPQIRIGS